jgi:hypothetical protein
MQFSPTSRHFIPLRSKYSPQHPVLKHPPSMFLNVRDQVSHPNRVTCNIYCYIKVEKQTQQVVLYRLGSVSLDLLDYPLYRLMPQMLDYPLYRLMPQMSSTGSEFRDSSSCSVRIVTRLWSRRPKNRGSMYSVQPGTETYPASYPMGDGASLLWGKFRVLKLTTHFR